MKESKKIKTFDKKTLDKIIAWAWDDRKTFDEIKEEFSLSEKEVIVLMRTHLKRSSWIMWRKRVNGRITKHRKIFLNKRREGEILDETTLEDIIDTEE